MAVKKKLVLRQTYKGRPTGEQPIEPGTYVIDDPRLFGVGNYLLKHGFAHDAGLVTVPDAPPTADEEPLDTPSEATMALAEQIAARLVAAAQVSQNAAPDTPVNESTEMTEDQPPADTPVEEPEPPFKPATNPNAAKKKASK